jgi:hypothetical protein
MEEIGEGEAFLRVMTLMQNPLYEPARIGRGAAHLSLVLHQEPKELINRHVIPTAGEPRERFLHVGRRTHLAHLEFPAEPKHLVLVARHFFPTQQFFHSPTPSLFPIFQWPGCLFYRLVNGVSRIVICKVQGKRERERVTRWPIIWECLKVDRSSLDVSDSKRRVIALVGFSRLVLSSN